MIGLDEITTVAGNFLPFLEDENLSKEQICEKLGVEYASIAGISSLADAMNADDTLMLGFLMGVSAARNEWLK